jgi:hypothetical protein
MFTKIENPFNKRDFNDNPSLSHYIGALENLLDLVNDKDEQIKGICEASLITISGRNSNDTVNFIIKYKKKNTKINDGVAAVILR